MYDPSPAETLEYHRSMLTDNLRTEQFLRAILQVVKPGDIVLDIGSGTGILAYFACLAGAEHVYAIESGEIVEVARAVCRANGIADRVTFFNDWSTRIDLPQLADVLISETIGNMGFEEGILGWVIDARERLLKPETRIIPQSVSLIAAPVERPREGVYLQDWQRRFFTFDYTPIHRVAANQPHWCKLNPDHLLAAEARLATIQLDANSKDGIEGRFVFQAQRTGSLDGLGAWFEAELAPGVSISNTPPNPAPSWSNFFLPLEIPAPVQPGDRIGLRLIGEDNGAIWSWEVEVTPTFANGKKPQPNYQAHGSTKLAGMEPPDLFQADFKPLRNLEAEVEQFILQHFDGSTSLESITMMLKWQFPRRYGDLEEARARVYETAAAYADHQSYERTNGHLSKEIKPS